MPLPEAKEALPPLLSARVGVPVTVTGALKVTVMGMTVVAL